MRASDASTRSCERISRRFSRSTAARAVRRKSSAADDPDSGTMTSPIRCKIARSPAILYLNPAMSGTPNRSLADRLRAFAQMESASGLVLLAAAVLALVASNTPLAPLYGLFLHTPVEVRVGALHLDKPLLLWINDGLMALFFLVVGAEIKREL